MSDKAKLEKPERIQRSWRKALEFGEMCPAGDEEKAKLTLADWPTGHFGNCNNPRGRRR